MRYIIDITPQQREALITLGINILNESCVPIKQNITWKLELNNRVLTAINKLCPNVKTLQELYLYYTDNINQFNKLPNFGIKSHRELRVLFNKYGYNIKEI